MKELISIFVLLFFATFVTAKHYHHWHQAENDRGFKVNCEKDRFEMDGEPFQYIAGEIHYFRIPHQLWDDRLQRMRAMGLNVAQIYAAWNWHEEKEGQFNFNGDRNIAEFIRLAAKNDMHVNLRMGPYICAEWEMGGLPSWLLKYDNVTLRDNKEPYISFAKRWLKRLSDEVKDLQYPEGPIIMAQVENEYGSYSSNVDYMNSLASTLTENGINKALLYTTDGPWNVKKGSTPKAYSTVDFGVSSEKNVEDYFKKQRNVTKCGPAVNSEFYTGWFDGWNRQRSSYPSGKDLTDTMGYMLKHNASFSFYMAHGGTNFGFWEGGEVDATIITSYDYGSPITESGQISDKYLDIRRFIKQIPNWKNKPLSIPKNHTAFKMSGIASRRLNKSLPQLFLAMKQNCKNVREPEPFEKFDQFQGYAIYSHKFNGNTPSQLNIKFLRDLAYVFIGDEYQGVLGNCTIDVCFNRDLALNSKAKGDLYIIVENLGRLNFNHGNDMKGIRSSVLADGKTLTDWTECGVDLNRLPNFVSNFIETEEEPFSKADSGLALGIYLSSFNVTLPDDDLGAFTYFDGANWGKGQLFLNEYNVGRYWPKAGPQNSIYVPGVFFKNKQFNNVILINFEPKRSTGFLKFVTDLTWTQSFSSEGLKTNRNE